jgi:hypothetical protein
MLQKDIGSKVSLPFENEALGILEMAKLNIVDYGYLIPVVFLFHKDNIQIAAIEAPSELIRETYAAFWEECLPKNPKCIIMVNQALIRPSDEDIISIIVYPRGAVCWGMIVRFRKDQEYIFDNPIINDNADGISLAGDLGPQPWHVQANLKYRKPGLDMAPGGKPQ